MRLWRPSIQRNRTSRNGNRASPARRRKGAAMANRKRKGPRAIIERLSSKFFEVDTGFVQARIDAAPITASDVVSDASDRPTARSARRRLEAWREIAVGILEELKN